MNRPHLVPQLVDQDDFPIGDFPEAHSVGLTLLAACLEVRLGGLNASSSETMMAVNPWPVARSIRWRTARKPGDPVIAVSTSA
jgi:hypothetical protein